MPTSSSSSFDDAQGHHVQADLQSVMTTLVVFAIISMSIYYFVLKPILSIGGDNRPGDGAVTSRQVARNNRAVRQQHRMAAAAHQYNNNNNHHNHFQQNSDSEVLTLLAESTRCPPHVSPLSTKKHSIGGSNILVDGLVPFRHGRAVAYESKEDLSQNRRERAKVLASAFSFQRKSTSTSPPSRGSTIVVSISSTEVDCPKLRRVLFLLATMYNLFVILSFEKDVEDAILKETTSKLRGTLLEQLPPEVLPDHRIVAAQSVTGRVAFVRQLARVELVLDFDTEVESQLSRFGFNVLVYGKDVKVDGTTGSLLGKSLLPS